MGSTGGSAIRSPPNTFQHAELPLTVGRRSLHDGNAHTDANAAAAVPGAGAAERKGLWV